MEPNELLKVLHTVGTLRDTPRHCVTPGGKREDVAEHSWRIALMTMLCADEFPALNMNKVIRMCLIHDLGECFTGDIPSFQKTDRDSGREKALLSEWVSSLPEPYCKDFAALYAEMDALQSPEAKLYKALDKMEAIVSHNESAISSWEPLEYDLNLTYGNEAVAHDAYLKAVRKAILDETLQKMEQEK